MSIFVATFLSLFQTKMSYTLITISCSFALFFLTFNIFKNRR